jgi:alpha-tubulin suppressor-like RCC1 family protein
MSGTRCPSDRCDGSDHSIGKTVSRRRPTRTIVPAMVPGLTDCQQIAGGASHTCAVRTGNTVACWGLNSSGQTGQPGADSIDTPRPVPGLSNVKEVGCGDAYSCARLANGTVMCWGSNRAGQLGDGTTTGRATPAPVMGVADAVELAVGRTAACVRHKDSGQVSCWGANDVNQLGDGTLTNRSRPISVYGFQ